MFLHKSKILLWKRTGDLVCYRLYIRTSSYENIFVNQGLEAVETILTFTFKYLACWCDFAKAAH